ncbi:uncharacterized protein LOC124371476 [Homalodisca vitripennis]|uniref:uncharacterized protein LOC124371476 n=1 Tax=Homalodisca vitripennis TaxID=197043 RepID=UPI001EE9CADB|nr:uncharacterized protein LOC124371476 [Homalodisca vitripennis]
MSKDFWNQDNIVMLIQLYESNKLLWDISDKEYKNKFKRKDAYAAIATELGVNAEEVKKKIDSILARYRREKKTNILKSGMGTSEKKKPWWGFPYLQFLSGNNSTPRETFSNLTEPNDPAVDMDSSDIDDNDIDNVCRETASSISSSSVKTPSRYSTPGTSRSGLESLSASGRAKRLKKNQVNEAYDIMKSCLSDLQSQQPTLRDDYAVYGENVANRLRKIKNPLSLCKLQNAIDNLIFQVEMKELEKMQKETEVTAYTTQERPAPSHPPEHGSTDVSLLMGTSLLDLPDNFSHL